VEDGAGQGRAGNDRRISEVIRVDERRLQGKRLLRYAGAHPVPRMTLDPRALPLAIATIRPLQTSDRKTESRGEAERDCTQSQTTKWARRFFHQTIIFIYMNM
jgi:hypothetical protein